MAATEEATMDTAAKRERLVARTTPEVKALIQRAADLTGQSVTEFLVGSALTAAEETIRAHEVIRLSARDSAILIEALLNPPQPNEALWAAARDYRELFGE